MILKTNRAKRKQNEKSWSWDWYNQSIEI